MSSQSSVYDAVVVGAGPNGLAAAITLARAGHSVAVFEASDTIGGGCRSKELTLPGYIHDVCSAIHPLAIGSPFFKTLPLERFGLEWIQPPVALAHPLDDGSAACLDQDFDRTADSLGNDGRAWRQFVPWPGARLGEAGCGISATDAAPAATSAPPGALRSCRPRPGFGSGTASFWPSAGTRPFRGHCGAFFSPA